MRRCRDSGADDLQDVDRAVDVDAEAKRKERAQEGAGGVDAVQGGSECGSRGVAGLSAGGMSPGMPMLIHPIAYKCIA
jgi:hypothetical protein